MFDLGQEAERIELYEIVPIDGAEDDVCRYVDRRELVRLWARLWPDQMRRAWKPRQPITCSS